MYRVEKSPWALRLKMPAVDDLGIMKHKRVFVLYKLAAMHRINLQTNRKICRKKHFDRLICLAT